jgi:MFS family permease
MYQVGGWLDAFRVRGKPSGAVAQTSIPANVWALGLTSLFTDISSEMVASVLPVYLVGFLRMSPAQFGFIDGLYQGVAALVQLGGAAITDRLRRYKEAAAFGYGASLVCRVGLLATRGTLGVSTFLTLDRLGKGLRSAPRDALISLSVPRDRLGAAFGVHRAMDAVGAMLGPLAAFAVLRAVPNGFDVVFVVSLCAAVIGFAVLVLLVENRQTTAAPVPVGMALTRAVVESAPFRHLLGAAILLGAVTVSDPFVYLTLQRNAALPSAAVPLLYVITSASYLVFAVPVGRLADRAGRFAVFLCGYSLLIALYLLLLAAPGGIAFVAAALLLLGLFYAATEGVLMALGSAILPENLRTSGLALLTTGLAVARFLGSTAFGISWTRYGLERTLAVFLAGLVVAIGVLALTRPRSDHD